MRCVETAVGTKGFRGVSGHTKAYSNTLMKTPGAQTSWYPGHPNVLVLYKDGRGATAAASAKRKQNKTKKALYQNLVPGSILDQNLRQNLS